MGGVTAPRVSSLVRRRPYHAGLGAFVGGLCCAAVAPRVAVPAAALIVAGLTSLRAAPLAAACGALVLVGAAVGDARLEAIDAPAQRLESGATIAARANLLERPRASPFGTRAEIRVTSGPASGMRLLGRASRWVRWPPRLAIGAELRVRGVARPPQSRPGADFDFAAYLRQRGIAGELWLDSVEATGRRRGGLAGAIDTMRVRAERAVESGLPPPEAALMRGMVLGEDERIDAATREDWRDAGLAHLLAVSGQNVMLLAALALPLLGVAGLGPRGRGVALLGLIAIYVPLAGAGPSLQRAGVMGAAATAAMTMSRPASRWYALLLAAAVTLVLNARSCMDPGWQLSFAAVAGILVLGRPLARALTAAAESLLPARSSTARPPPPGDDTPQDSPGAAAPGVPAGSMEATAVGSSAGTVSAGADGLRAAARGPNGDAGHGLRAAAGGLRGEASHGLRRRLLRGLAEGCAITVAATVATAPLLAYHFDSVPVAGLPANLLALPAVAPAMWLGMVKAGLGELAAALPAAAGVAHALGPVARLPTSYLGGLAVRFADFPGGQVALPLGSPAAVIAAYVTIALVTAGVWRAARRTGPRTVGLAAAWRRRPRAQRHAAVAALLAGLAAGLSGLLSGPDAPSRLTVRFLDVGQGDATLIQHPDGAAVLFDGGPPEAGVSRLLRRAGVRRLTLVVATHASRDHHGGLRDVLRRFPVGLLLNGGDRTRDRAFRAVLAEAARRGIRQVPAIAPMTLYAGALTIRVLSPSPRPPGPPPEDPNTRAVVAVVSSGGFDLFLSADAESEALLPLGLTDVDAMKVPHHGSADPGLPEVLDRLRPELAAIEVGKANTYGHPRPSTIAALDRAGVPTYRTDRDGTVTVTVEEESMQVQTEQ
jgi:ComEC/Rec2-related protein